MCFIADEYAEVYHAHSRRARKDHQCYECNDGIKAGEIYEYGSGVFDGRGFSQKTCRRCVYDRARIYQIERRNGCRDGESFPLAGGILDGLCHCQIQQTPRDNVPADFDMDPRSLWKSSQVKLT